MQMKNSLTGTCPIVDNKPSVREPFRSSDLRGDLRRAESRSGLSFLFDGRSCCGKSHSLPEGPSAKHKGRALRTNPILCACCHLGARTKK